MAYIQKSDRNSQRKSKLSQKKLDELNANKKVDDIRNLTNGTNTNETNIVNLYEVKQDNLVSGENIATINGESILEGKDIELPTKCFTIAMSIAL